MASSTASGSSFVGERKKVVCQHSACFCGIRGERKAVRVLLPIGQPRQTAFSVLQVVLQQPAHIASWS